MTIKKKLSALIISSVIMVLFAGCQSDNQQSTSRSSDVGGDYSLVFSDVSENNDEKSNESSKVQITYYTVWSVEPSAKAVLAKAPDLREPVIFTIKTYDEFLKFYNDNKDKYSLDDVESGVSFADIMKDFDSVLFDENDAFIIIQEYEKNDGIEFQDIYINGSKLEICVAKKEVSSNAAFNCSIVSVPKGERGNAVPVVSIVSPGREIYEESNANIGNEENYN